MEHTLEKITKQLEKEGIALIGNDPDNEYGLERLYLSKRREYIEICQIRVLSQGNGNGTRIMNALAELADRKGWILHLTPSKELGATSITRLKKFYKRFGFRENRGKNTDFLIFSSMIRKPKPAQNA